MRKSVFDKSILIKYECMKIVISLFEKNLAFDMNLCVIGEYASY